MHTRVYAAQISQVVRTHVGTATLPVCRVNMEEITKTCGSTAPWKWRLNWWMNKYPITAYTITIALAGSLGLATRALLWPSASVWGGLPWGAAAV